MRVIDVIITKFENIVTFTSFVLMTIITIIGVFYRYVLSDPLAWSEEVSRYLMVIGIFIGLSIVTRENAQLGIDIFISYTKGLINHLIQIILNIIIILVFLWLLIISIDFVISSKGTNQLTPMTRIPFYYLYSIISLGFLLCSYRAIQNFANYLKTLNVEKGGYK